MTSPGSHISRAAFLIKYGYAPDLAPNRIYAQVRQRYDQAEELRRRSATPQQILLAIEGFPPDASEEDTFWERVIRKYRLEKLCAEHGLSAIEADLLAEEYIARLELQWIQSAEHSSGGKN
ncbi:MAG: hypothetical protein JO170_32465 [Verrucomicrobia bacterium]|nr:hypothetical protein [Verrucomicrobiota bacterium]